MRVPAALKGSATGLSTGREALTARHGRPTVKLSTGLHAAVLEKFFCFRPCKKNPLNVFPLTGIKG